MPALDHHSSILLIVGGILIAALLFGRLSGILHLPRVTAYLLVGLCLAPYTLSLVPEGIAESSLIHTLKDVGEQLHHLHPLADLAMALVLFNMGCRFTLVHFRRIRERAYHLSRGELFFTFMFVFGGLVLLHIDLYSACLYGVLALATAPATTMLVLKEAESEGPLTEYATTLVALNNLVAVVAFEFLFFLISWHDGELVRPWPRELLQLFLLLCGSLLLGLAGGLVVSYLCGRFEPKRWLLVLASAITFVLGICLTYDLPYLLTFLAMGLTVANSSDHADDIVKELTRITSLLCLIFFVVHGAEMNIGALIAAGSVGLVYIGCRTVGKFVGIYATAAKEGRRVRQWLGLTLISQAGAALTLAGQAAARNPDRCAAIQQVILGSVVFFEIVGPILVRQAVVRSGETPLDKAIMHTSTSVWEGLQSVANRLLVALGRDPFAKSPVESLTVGQLMRRNVKGIQASSHFDDVAHWIEHSHDNTFPVIGIDEELLGVIRYLDIRDTVFDPELAPLVNASDMAVEPQLTLHADDCLTKALDYFRAGTHDAIPIVERETNRYVGLVRRKDLIRFFRRTQDMTILPAGG